MKINDVLFYENNIVILIFMGSYAFKKALQLESAFDGRNYGGDSYGKSSDF